MIPPWEQYPDIPAGSIGWRMGRGEEYYDCFYKWYSALASEDRAQFASENPEPRAWRGVYQRIADHPWLD